MEENPRINFCIKIAHADKIASQGSYILRKSLFLSSQLEILICNNIRQWMVVTVPGVHTDHAISHVVVESSIVRDFAIIQCQHMEERAA